MVRPVVVLLWLWLAMLSSADARTVYLNGVKLDDAMVLKNQSFLSAEVRFDDKGDVWITAKGYKVQIKSVDLSSAPIPTRQHWLVVREARRGSSGYQIDVYLNEKLVRRTTSGDDQLVADVTAQLRAGDNRVRIIARKLDGKRLSTAPEDTISVVIGEGQLKEGKLTVERPLLEYKRNAAETTGFTDDFRLVAR
jgi:hypothetical protein